MALKTIPRKPLSAADLNPPITDPHPIPGYARKLTYGGKILHVRLHYSADPAKTPEWRNNHILFNNTHKWDREMEIKWTAPAGQAVYPHFSREKHVLECTKLIAGPIYRGWDFGVRRPSCVWMQKSRKTGRVWVLRAIIGGDESMDTYAFRDLVKWLSGQLPMSQLGKRPDAVRWVNWARTQDYIPKMPWFDALSHSYIDYAGHEALMRDANVEGSVPRTARDVLAAGGIELNIQTERIAARETVVAHGLYDLPSDGLPRLLFDPACGPLIDAMGGMLTYAKPTSANPEPEKIRKDGFYDNLHDALGYPLLELLPVDDSLNPAAEENVVGRVGSDSWARTEGLSLSDVPGSEIITPPPLPIEATDGVEPAPGQSEFLAEQERAKTPTLPRKRSDFFITRRESVADDEYDGIYAWEE